jgi:GNAT superfamily N-acetyltransferase
LQTVLHDPRVSVHALLSGGRSVGLLELDFRVEAECELAYFGLVSDAIGTGAGRFLIAQAVDLAWRRPIKRFWVHTCHFDHPAALDFYQRAGFRPYKMMVEVMDDPRLTGVLPRSAAPHVPLIEVV